MGLFLFSLVAPAWQILMGAAVLYVGQKWLGNNGTNLDNLLLDFGAGTLWGAAAFGIMQAVTEFKKLRGLDRRIEEVVFKLKKAQELDGRTEELKSKLHKKEVSLK